MPSRARAVPVHDSATVTPRRTSATNFAFDKVREREILRVTAKIVAGTTATDAERVVRQEALAWAAEQIGDPFPSSAVDGGSFEHLWAGRTCMAAGFVDDQRRLWAMRVDVPDATVAQRVWTTEVAIGHAPGSSSALFSLRLMASSPEAALTIDPAVPSLLHTIAARCELTQGGGAMQPGAWWVTTEQDARKLLDELLDPNRALPYLVCSINEREQVPRLHALKLSKATFGIARVVVIAAEQAWLLTGIMGKLFSVFNGAVRAYLPGFSLDGNPFTHTLLLSGPKLSREQSSAAATDLRWIAAEDSLRRLRLDRDVLSFSSVRKAGLEVERDRLVATGSADSERLTAAQREIHALKDDLRRSSDTQQWLSDEHRQAEESLGQVHQQLRGAQFRIQQLLAQIKAQGHEPDADVRLPDRWGEFGDWCDDVLSGRVSLSARARRETKAAEFEDPALAAQCLLWLANEYRDSRMTNDAQGDLRRPVGHGVYNDRCGSDAFFMPWAGRRVSVEWHLKNGGNTRDPRRCLRIYYFWDDETQTVVVASMPAHTRNEIS